MDFSWASPFPEVHKVCKLFQMAEICHPLRFKYKPLPEFLQDGTKCGLVALAMLLDRTTKDFIDVLYQSAKELNFTNNGEMFSANDMASLARRYFSGDTEIVVYEGVLNNKKICDFLLEGGLMLVPYDSDKDNSPGFHNGHKAHWAALSGGILTEDAFFVIARHGKARNIAIWKLDRLSDSNKQLFEFSPDRKLHDVQYKLPKEGIAGADGLNEKSVLIKVPLQ